METWKDGQITVGLRWGREGGGIVGRGGLARRNFGSLPEAAEVLVKNLAKDLFLLKVKWLLLH